MVKVEVHATLDKTIKMALALKYSSTFQSWELRGQVHHKYPTNQRHEIAGVQVQMLQRWHL